MCVVQGDNRITGRSYVCSTGGTTGSQAQAMCVVQRDNRITSSSYVCSTGGQQDHRLKLCVYRGIAMSKNAISVHDSKVEKLILERSRNRLVQKSQKLISAKA